MRVAATLALALLLLAGCSGGGTHTATKTVTATKTATATGTGTGTGTTSSGTTSTSAAYVPITFTLDEAQDRLVVAAADRAMDWRNVKVAGECDNGATTNIGGKLTEDHQNRVANEENSTAISSFGCFGGGDGFYTAVAVPSAPVKSNDFLSFCATGEAETAVNVTIMDSSTSKAIGTFGFASIALCL
jgi:hypothetical protein